MLRASLLRAPLLQFNQAYGKNVEKARESMGAKLTPVLELQLFGAPQLRLGGEVINDKISGRPLALLTYLAVTGRPHTRDLLADLLWDELTSQQARNNLRYLLPDLRRVIGDYLLINAQTIAFNQQAPHWLDVDALRTIQSVTPPMSTQAWQQVLDLYQGEFLAGFRVRNAPNFEAWVTAQQEELHEVAMQGFQQLAQRYLAEGDSPAGITTVKRLLASDPWHEAGQRLLMQLLVASGQRAAALEQYQQFRNLLQNEVGVEPAAATKALYEQIRCDEIVPVVRAPPLTRKPPAATSEPVERNAERPNQPAFLPKHTVMAASEQPPRVVAPLPKHNLPRQLTPLIGRQIELVALRAKLLNPAYPLLILTGEGGIGKTRLAIAAVQSLLDRPAPDGEDASIERATASPFDSGIWFIPLAGIASGDGLHERLAATIGETLGLAFAGHEPLQVQLFTQLRHKQVLLVLDNFEHLENGTAFVLDLLKAAPKVKLLLTSRRQLALQAAYSWMLDGLPFPTLPETATASERTLLDYESIALFVERARRARPKFQFDQENRTAVVQICHRLEGSPLGIELAATLVSQHSCSEIAITLADHYSVLATTLEDIPAAHRSMQSVLTYSWQLLAPAEAQILARCAFFRSGFTLDAARAVAGATPELLARLIDHSLLTQVRDSAGQMRYQLHEVVRQYALEQLLASATIAHLTAEQYCIYYTAFLAGQEVALQRSAHARHLIQADLDNIRAAWRWAIEQQKTEALAQGLACLSAFYEFVGFFQEARLMLAEASDAVRPLTAKTAHPALDLLLGNLLSEQAGFCLHLNQLEEACQLARHVMQLGEQRHHGYLQADGRRRLGAALKEMGELTTAITMLEEGLALARQENFPRVMARCLHNIGMLHYRQGEYRKALVHYQEALTLAQQIGDQITESPLAHNIGITYLVLGDFTQALAYLEENIRTGRELGWQRLLAFATMNLGYLLALVGEFTRAQQASVEALAIFVNLGCRSEEANTRAQLCGIYHALGDNEQAYAFGLQALAIAEAEHYALERGLALQNLGNVMTTMQRWQEARYLYEQALTVWQALKNADQIALARSALAFVALQQQQFDQAQALIERILPELNNISVDGVSIFVVCYQVLVLRHDPRAAAVLRQGYAFIQTQYATLQDDRLRHAFLTEVAANRTLLELAKQAGIA